MKPVQLTADLVEAFSGMYLSPRYDKPRPTPEFHREAWTLYCSNHLQCEIIAPRDHAKSTALTFDYGLAEALFRSSDYIILIGSTEEMAQEQLSNLSEELHENQELVRDFGPFEFKTDQKTELVIQCPDGHRFRILARGSEQKIRGRMWKGKRPNLILCDDMEDDEQVESKDRRRKFRRWFFRAARQALGKGGKIRVHGTILHEDSLLARLRRNSQWKHLFFKAHAGFDDFSDILWPERWNENELRSKRQEFIDDNDAPGYAQEYLNDPMDTSEPYLRQEDFLPMDEDDHEAEKVIAAGWDFAISRTDAANKTSCTVGGKDVTNTLHIVDERLGKWGTLTIIEEFFSVQRAWNPQVHFVEDGQIWKTLEPILQKEMRARDIYLNTAPLQSVKDKAVRGRTLQKQHRARAMRFDKDASWYQAYEHELLRFREDMEAAQDDQFDSTSILCRGLEKMSSIEVEDLLTDDEEEFHAARQRRRSANVHDGRSSVTGY